MLDHQSRIVKSTGGGPEEKSTAAGLGLEMSKKMGRVVSCKTVRRIYGKTGRNVSEQT